MVDLSFVLADLRNQFSGHSVLYAPDIAKLLAKSEKAIAHLIARNDLPFKIKVVGGRRCVDIYQVAEWFANDQDCVAPNVPLNLPNRGTKSPKKSKPDSALALKDDKSRVLTGKMAVAIVGARSEKINTMGRFVYGLGNKDELAFMSEVFEEIFFGDTGKKSTYTVTIRSIGSSRSKNLAKEVAQYFATEELAADFLVLQLIRVRNLDHKQATHYMLDHSGKRLFHLVITGKSWTFVNNKLGLDLPGV